MGRGNRPSPLLCPGNSVVARAHQDAVRHACDRNEAVCLVADFHGVNGRASAEVNGGRGSGDDSLASGADVRSVQFRSNGVGLLARVSFTRVDLGGKRRCGLREGGRCAAVEDPGALAVSLDGHRNDGARGAVLQHFHPGGFHQGARPVGTDPPAACERIW